MGINTRLLPVFLVLFCIFNSILAVDFNLTILHTNDVHARFEEINAFGGPCSSDCFGGVARRQTAIQEMRRSHENVLLLDAGDQFQGTIWYNYYKGNATKYFMEQLGYDVMTLGNHEFDDGTADLAQFLNGLSFPVVCANLNSDQVPALQGLYTSSQVLDVNGRNVGVIGYITEDTPELVFRGRDIRGLVFGNVLTSVKAEAEKLASQGIDIIIVLGHGGYLVDLEIAKKVSQVDVVVGGHTNTFLYSGDPPSNEDPLGPYPAIVTRNDGSKVPVVQAFTQGKYLGYLNVIFDDNGDVTRWNGNPVLLDSSVALDPDIKAKVEEWNKPIAKVGQEVIGHSLVFMDGERTTCRMKECNMGNMATDSMVRYCLARLPASQGWARVAIGLLNSGVIRASFPKGDISMKSVLETYPYRNTMEVVELPGSAILAMLENSVKNYNADAPPGRFLQVSGMRVTYNIKKEPGNRVVSVEVLCTTCDIPEYVPLDANGTYMVVTNNYMVYGGDGYSMIKEKRKLWYPLGKLLKDRIVQYINFSSPLTYGFEGRIQFTEDDKETTTKAPTADKETTTKAPTSVKGIITKVITAPVCDNAHTLQFNLFLCIMLITVGSVFW